jgi:C-terminal processing protease CtpA/Prc
MRIAAAVLIALGMTAIPAQSLTLVGSVEKSDVEGRIGVRIATSGIIREVHPGSPAEAAGLQPKDHVLTVDGKRHAIRQISGEPGTIVELDVKRHGERFHVAVERVDVRTIWY